MKKRKINSDAKLHWKQDYKVVTKHFYHHQNEHFLSLVSSGVFLV